MNKKLGPGILFILSLVLLYLGGVVDGAIGAGLAVGGLICLALAILGGIKKLAGGGRQQRSTEVLNHAKRIVKTSEHFYQSMTSKNNHSISKADVTLDITGYCLYVTFKELINSGYKTEDCKHMLEQLTKHISFYIERDVSFSDLYMKHFMAITELLGIESSEEEYKPKMKKHLIKSYNLKPETSVLETTLIEQIDSLIKTQSLIKALR